MMVSAEEAAVVKTSGLSAYAVGRSRCLLAQDVLGTASAPEAICV